MIEVLSSGLYTTIQDLGRYGYRKYGVPLSGVMDGYSAKLANQLLGNTKNCAVLEITLTGPVLKFKKATQIVITGAGFTPTLNYKEIFMNTPVEVPSTSILSFGLPAYGFRGYLAVAGGFKTENVLGSSSFYKGITQEGLLQKGTVLEINPSERSKIKTNALVSVKKTHFIEKNVEVQKGPEFDNLTKSEQRKLQELQFTVTSKSNRMAYLLECPSILTVKEIITAPVQPGTVQITPSGKIMVLMRDAQTTGGYARILQLTEKSINQLAQKRAGDKVGFLFLEY
ncbi:MAG: allophanate hydrolase [Flavobacteriaceae bacterium CG_4_8_14_3_um_filter_34_10]|nr:biotin-dependent carboxyltransferase family protein [Flavobacteriia bacterium]OIP50131.1 MAG: hypothetical protein AUK33_08250 [Flavobacteriaceae bacterium CG2_30_34_30]PIQ18324.1 MAG: allophanate hydrolase [Flavobacteriaceae bacterium CG18_big_fil_WC_8_21_14_2_50_34_36]PIV49441.1 MAG: allophanate hydrolase [Flavobacteriaceae bacterium CG02_land_8_20_14_3_00_34_13]PIX10234.1 MAG: allophanate hydrolase [Flavobacteriaceae bacterium CG_4_8_14_3_um_filter_34_10]PIZ08235.1 MAG: allophanate hydro